MEELTFKHSTCVRHWIHAPDDWTFAHAALAMEYPPLSEKFFLINRRAKGINQCINDTRETPQAIKNSRKITNKTICFVHTNLIKA